MSELAKIRRSRGLSQRALASVAEMSPSSIYEIEVGRRKPNPSTLRKLAGALGVEVVDLLEEDERPKASSRPEFFELPGLDAALKRHGMGRRKLAYRAGMTTGELFDYEVGEKKPSYEIVTRLAAALSPDCFPAELVTPPDQAEEFIAEDRRQNALIQDKREEWLQEMREEQLRNPKARRISEDIKEAYRKNDEQRAREHPEAG